MALILPLELTATLYAPFDICEVDALFTAAVKVANDPLIEVKRVFKDSPTYWYAVIYTYCEVVGANPDNQVKTPVL